MAQLGARLNGIEEVEGSNPSGSTTQLKPLYRYGERFHHLWMALSSIGNGLRFSFVCDNPDETKHKKACIFEF